MPRIFELAQRTCQVYFYGYPTRIAFNLSEAMCEQRVSRQVRRDPHEYVCQNCLSSPTCKGRNTTII